MKLAEARSVGIFLILTIFAWTIASFSFLHSHQLHSGRVLAHSHVSKTQDTPPASQSSHEHSEFEYLFYQLNSIEYHLNYAPPPPVLTLFAVGIHHQIETQLAVTFYSPATHSIRAPPLR